MNKTTWGLLSLFVMVSVFTLWSVSKDDVGELNPLLAGQRPLDTHTEITPTQNKVLKKQDKHQVLHNEAQEDLFNPYQNEVLKAQLQQVSDIYAENIKYPITSQPIYNPEDAREYKEFEQAEVDLPFPDGEGDENPIRILVATDSFQYFTGDTVSVRVQIRNAPTDVFTQVSGVISGANGDLAIEGVFEPSDHSLTQFNAAFDTGLAPANLLTPEMVVKLNVTIGDRSLFTTAAFRYAAASAQIVGIGQVTTDGPNLVIPLQVNVFENGYFFVNGILEDAQNGRPLIHLQAEKRLELGNGIINLSAHISALRRQDSQGPYILRSLRSYRGSEIGESFDAPASSSQSRFAVPGFAFSAYQEHQYLDEQGQERLEFLRGLGSVSEDQTRESKLQADHEHQNTF